MNNYATARTAIGTTAAFAGYCYYDSSVLTSFGLSLMINGLISMHNKPNYVKAISLFGMTLNTLSGFAHLASDLFNTTTVTTNLFRNISAPIGINGVKVSTIACAIAAMN